MLTLALLVGAALALREGRRARLEQGALISCLATAVGAGFVGAFLASVGVRWLQLGSLHEALAAPGIVYYGALVGGALGLGQAARWLGLPVLATLDAMIPAVPVGHALGRVGCFLGGCCYGLPTHVAWAVRYPTQSVSRHPWPLYEAAALCGLALLFGRRRRAAPAPAPGRRALGYVTCYALLRLSLEPLRGDGVRGLWAAFGVGISTSQLISLGLLALGVAVLVVEHRRGWPRTGPSG